MKNIRSLNKIAKEYDLQLIQGDGYLYWVALTQQVQEKADQMYDTSIATNRFSDLSFERWLIELNEFKSRLENPTQH